MVFRRKLDSAHQATTTRSKTQAEAQQKLDEPKVSEPTPPFQPEPPSREHIDVVVSAIQNEFSVPAPVMRAGERVVRAAVKNSLQRVVHSQAEKVTGSRVAAKALVYTAGVATSIDENAEALFNQLWPAIPHSPSKRAVDDALKSLIRPELSAGERRRMLSEASRDPLTSLVLESLNDVASFLPANLIGKGAEQLANVVKANEKRLAGSKFAPSLRNLTNAKQTAEAIERVRSRLNTPEFRTGVANALGVLRAFGRVQAEHLAALSLDLSGEKKVAMQRAVEQYTIDVAESLVHEVAPDKLPLAQRTLELLRLTRLHLRAAEGQLRDRDFEQLLNTLNSLASDATTVVKSPVTDLAPASLGERLETAQQKLVEKLSSGAVLSAESRKAVDELCADFTATTSMMVNVTQLVIAVALSTKGPDQAPAQGADGAPPLPEAPPVSAEQRLEDIKQAAKKAGPIVVKLAQTFANIASERGQDSVLMQALKGLQEAVPPMSDAQVRTQIEQDLGRPLEKSFVSFDWTPLASASIGQIHRAVIKRRFLGEREVAVKVQRPGLDAEFEKASRVTRIALATVREVIPVVADFLTSAGQTTKADFLRSDAFKGQVRLAEDTIRSFVDSFAIETDFIGERRNQQRYRRSIGIHPFVTAPRSYSQWSNERVLTMDFVHLEKLPSLMARGDVAKQAKWEPAPKTGPLPERTSDAKQDVTERSVAHVRRDLGLSVTASDVVVAPVPGGFQAVVTIADPKDPALPHPQFPTVKLKLDEDGTIHDLEAPPPMSPERVKRLQDRFFASLIAQTFVHGMVHGDPHKGNWGVAADGETVVMLDFGNVINLGALKPRLIAPLAIGVGAVARQEEVIALSALYLSDLSAKDPRRGEIYRDLLAALEDLATKPIDQRVQFAAAESVKVLAQHGVGLSDVYTQSIKAGVSLAGNFTGFSEAGTNLSFSSFGKAMGVSTLDLADALTLRVAGTVGKIAKDARIQRLQADDK